LNRELLRFFGKKDTRQSSPTTFSQKTPTMRPIFSPYVQQEELIIVTADIKNFAPLDESRHEGLFLLNDQRASAYSVAQAILDIIDQFRTPDYVDGKTLTLDPWIQE
jgi:hypothetical protein